jgi:hypothetical protein
VEFFFLAFVAQLIQQLAQIYYFPLSLLPLSVEQRYQVEQEQCGALFMEHLSLA